MLRNNSTSQWKACAQRSLDVFRSVSDCKTRSTWFVLPFFVLMERSWCEQAFNIVAQRDNEVSIQMAKHSLTDNTMMKTVAIVSLVYLPGTFVSVSWASYDKTSITYVGRGFLAWTSLTSRDRVEKIAWPFQNTFGYIGWSRSAWRLPQSSSGCFGSTGRRLSGYWGNEVAEVRRMNDRGRTIVKALDLTDECAFQMLK